MINIQEYLKKEFIKDENKKKNYAIVRYVKDSKIVEEIVYFSSYNINGLWFLEAPCCVYDFPFECTKEEFCEKFTKDFVELEEGVDAENYVKEFVEPLIRENVYYEIDCPQTGPFLPKEVISIKLITESDALDYILNVKKGK